MRRVDAVHVSSMSTRNTGMLQEELKGFLRSEETWMNRSKGGQSSSFGVQIQTGQNGR